MRHTVSKYPLALLMLCFLTLGACGNKGEQGTAVEKPDTPEQTLPLKPRQYTYRVKNEYPHLRTSYTQGLLYDRGILWEGTGQNGASKVQRVDLESGRAEVLVELPRSEFGEGIALLDERIYQLTWTSNRAHVYDMYTGEKIQDFTYAGEGWGLTTDGEKLYMSNGSVNIFVLSPEDFTRERTITVTDYGKPVRMLNELEWIDGKIWANVYLTDRIAIIDPASGAVEGWVDLTGILDYSLYEAGTDVLNGIAYDAEGKRIFVTGKNWPRLFEIELIEK